MKYLLLTVTLLVCSSVWGKDNKQEEAGIEPLTIDEKGELFRLVGSNTIGAQLAPLWCKDFLEKKGVAQVSIISLAAENEYRVEGMSKGQVTFISIKAHGSSTGFKALKAGSTDIAMASRAIKPAELRSLSDLGDLLDYSVEHIVGIDGLAVIAHPSNPVDSLSINEIARIFSGGYTNWKQVGGEDKPIHVLARNDESGTWDTFKSLVLRGKFKLAKSAQRFESNDQLAEQVGKLDGSIGFVALGSLENVKPLAIDNGRSNRFLPDKILVATEDYPLSRRLFLYAPVKHRKALVTEFIDFVGHSAGQQWVEQVGFVSQSPFGIKMPQKSGPINYQILSNHAERLSINFRFKSKSAQLDNKAMRDIFRLAEYLKKQKTSSVIKLVGFSDQRSNPAMAEVLSKLRASTVKMALFKLGVTTEKVEGLGSSLLVADSDGSYSERNNRVEVWIYSSEQALIISSEKNSVAELAKQKIILAKKL